MLGDSATTIIDADNPPCRVLVAPAPAPQPRPHLKPAGNKKRSLAVHPGSRSASLPPQAQDQEPAEPCREAEAEEDWRSILKGSR
jgi:hypothetical protein